MVATETVIIATSGVGVKSDASVGVSVAVFVAVSVADGVNVLEAGGSAAAVCVIAMAAVCTMAVFTSINAVGITTGVAVLQASMADIKIKIDT